MEEATNAKVGFDIHIWEHSLKDYLETLGSGWFDLNGNGKNASMCQKFERQVEQRCDLWDFDLIYIQDLDNYHQQVFGLYFFKKSNKVYWKFTNDLFSDKSEFVKDLNREIKIKLFNSGIGCLRSSEIQEKLEHGWICPKCGRINAPQVLACPCSIQNNSDGYMPPVPKVIGPFVDDNHLDFREPVWEFSEDGDSLICSFK